MAALRDAGAAERCREHVGNLGEVPPALEEQRHDLARDEHLGGAGGERAGKRQLAVGDGGVCAAPAKSRARSTGANRSAIARTTAGEALPSLTWIVGRFAPETTKPVTSPTSCSLPSEPRWAGTPLICSAVPSCSLSATLDQFSSARTGPPSRRSAAAVEKP